MTKQQLIILRGYPGSGKTTVGKLLAERRVGVLIDHNSILTFLANIVGDDDGIYDAIHTLEGAMAQKLLKDNKNAIVARGFSSPDSVNPYMDIAKNTNSELFIFKLIVSDSNLKVRVASKERKKDFNPTTNETALSAWVLANPLVDIKGEHQIDANKKPEEVVEQIRSIVNF